jgi:hypothetical protein
MGAVPEQWQCQASYTASRRRRHAHEPDPRLDSRAALAVVDVAGTPVPGPELGTCPGQGQVPQAGPPAVDSTRTAQKPSQALVQHSAFFAQTHFSIFGSAQPGPALSAQQLPLQVPQPRPPTRATQASFHPFSQQYLPPAMAHTHFSIAGSLHPPPA